ncbi:unnamed protein product [Effrenium voratum]|uniref:Uncharacterized protein n=2 Tax=Effrenium voratum TaxID=2562239 RepID=A0AA36JT46_9DINO|nr:unnamed protein product [Effrenium voratum]CAJ1424083.1 unnamed protein product [Effrenium voratum]
MEVKRKRDSHGLKMASVVPAGTEVTRQGADGGKRGRIMVVKPVAKAYILSGHMMSSMAFGDFLLRKKWPMAVAIILALVLHVLDFFGTCYEIIEVQVQNDQPVVLAAVPTQLSAALSVVCVAAFSVALLGMLTRVHSQLLWMTLRTFDPWAIIACAMRGWASRSFSRHSVHIGMERDLFASYYVAHVLDLVVILQFSFLIILAEAADVPKQLKRVCVAVCFIYCSLITLGALFCPVIPDWDPQSEVQFLFFASMTPKSQFISAYGTMAVLLTKAVVSTIFQKHAFMYLRCHYQYCMDQLDASFAQLAVSDPMAITYSDFRLALQEMGVSESHIFAGFNVLDVEQDGRVSLHSFRKSLMDVFAEFPDASHSALLSRFCQDAFNQASGYSSLDSMFGTVLSGWRRIKLEEFGESMYNMLTQDPALAKLFRRDKVRTQALLFAAFVQVALSWLEEKDFRRIERDMTSLGLRHRAYGIQPSYICLFQIALLQTLSTKLSGLSLHAEIAWSVVWSHFVVAPFLSGLVDVESARPGLYCTVKTLLQESSKAEGFIEALETNLNQVPGGQSNWLELFRDAGHMTSHLAMLQGFILRIAEDLDAGNSLKARQMIRSVAQIHWDRGVVPRHMLTFQHAMSQTFHEVLGPHVFTHAAESRWAVFMQTEVLEVILLAPFAETQDRVEEWASMCPQYVDKKSWNALMRQAYIEGAVADLGFQRLRMESGKDTDVTPGDVVKTFCDESMQHPSWTFEKVAENYCKTPPDSLYFLE